MFSGLTGTVVMESVEQMSRIRSLCICRCTPAVAVGMDNGSMQVRIHTSHQGSVFHLQSTETKGTGWNSPSPFGIS